MIRLILIVLLFLASLLCILKAPVYYLWFVAILVQEFPWIFVAAEVMLLAWGLSPQRFQVAGNAIAVISLLVFMSPIVRAGWAARTLPEQLTEQFAKDGGARATGSPFQPGKMIAGVGQKQIHFSTHQYAYHDGVSLTLDFYPSSLPGKRPCVMVIHGGSWAAGDSRQLPELNTVLAHEGYAVASINYRLAPRYKSPAPVEDVAAAIAFLKKNAAGFKIDTSRWALIGRSAGGQIALTAAYTLREPGLRGVVGFYAPADMVWGYSQPANPLIMDSRKVMEDYLGGTYAQVPENYVASSAIDFVKPASVPTLLIHGKNDVLVFYEHSIRLSKKLKENHVPHYLLTWPAGTHGGDYTLNGPSGQLSTYSVLYFLKTIF